MLGVVSHARYGNIIGKPVAAPRVAELDGTIGDVEIVETMSMEQGGTAGDAEPTMSSEVIKEPKIMRIGNCWE